METGQTRSRGNKLRLFIHMQVSCRMTCGLKQGWRHLLGGKPEGHIDADCLGIRMMWIVSHFSPAKVPLFLPPATFFNIYNMLCPVLSAGSTKKNFISALKTGLLEHRD